MKGGGGGDDGAAKALHLQSQKFAQLQLENEIYLLDSSASHLTVNASPRMEGQWCEGGRMLWQLWIEEE